MNQRKQSFFRLAVLCAALWSEITDEIRAEPWSTRGYVFGEVLSASQSFGVIDMGYGERLRSFQRVAVFRERNRVYHPIAVVQLHRVEASQSFFENLRNAPARPGDLVVVQEAHCAPLHEGARVEDYFVTTHIVTRGTGRGYETGFGSDLADTFQRQRAEVRNRRSEAWRESFGRYTVPKRHIEKDPQRALTLQLEFFANEARTNPSSFSSISDGWKKVLVWLQPALSFKDIGTNINDRRIARESGAFRPELDDEVSQVLRTLITHCVTSPMENMEAYFQVSLLHTQFGTLGEDERLLKEMADFVQSLTAEEADTSSSN